MADDLIVTDRDGPVIILTLNRPDALNALNRAMRERLAQSFNELAKDDSLKIVVLTGSGRAFTAGVDLKEVGQTGVKDDDNSFAMLPQALEQFPWPIIGAINGFAITGGLEIALMCDVILASDNAKFADTHVRYGLMPSWGASQRLARLIGVNRAKELSFTGNIIDAQTAEAWGLVNHVYSPQELLPAAVELGHQMAKNDASALRKYKRAISEGYVGTLKEGMELENEIVLDHVSTLSAKGIEAARVSAMKQKNDSN